MSDRRRENILNVAEVFEALSKTASEREMRDFNPPFPPSSDPARYGRHAKGIFAGQTEPDLTGITFRPAFVANSLRLLPGLSDLRRRFMLEVLATGVREFAGYYLEQEVSASGGVPEARQAELRAMQKRYFAYCLAQLLQCGMDFEGVLMTMKGDAMDVATSNDVAAMLEEGPERLLASPLFTDDEKSLWKAFFEKKPDAWLALHDHFVKAYAVPFKIPPAE